MDVAEELTPATDEWLPHWPLHWHCVDCRRQLLVELGVAKKSLEQQAEDTINLRAQATDGTDAHEHAHTCTRMRTHARTMHTQACTYTHTNIHTHEHA